MTEHAHDALVRTQISVGSNDRTVSAYIQLEAAGGAYQLGPLKVDIKSPVIVRTIASAFDDWQVGTLPVLTKALTFAGDQGGLDLAEAIWHPDRNLPLAVLSGYEDRTLSDDLPGELAADLCGVAIVATLDERAAWRLTLERGKEWSCFNGAIRLYWPSPGRYKPMQHPLWTRTSLLANSMSAADAASRLRRKLRRELLGLSAFSVHEPPHLGQVRKEHQKREALATSLELKKNEDWEGLANAYAEDNDRLRSKLDSAEEQIKDLQDQVANLQLSLRWKASADDHELPPDDVQQPATVREAVAIAQARHRDTLLFGSDVARGIDTLAADAGPPEKILGYFDQLAEMVKARNEGKLGNAPIKWLQKRGINCSGESETVRNSAEERRRRMWDDGVGPRQFDLHLKPADAVHPDRCVRIYFDYDDSRQLGAVGWVGRHP